MSLLKNFCALFLFSAISGCCITTAFAQGELPTRDKIEDRYKWNLTDLYKTDSDWEKEYNALESNLNKFDGYRGKISKSSKALLEYLKFNYELESRLSKLAIYASLSKDIDLSVGKYQAMADKISKLISNFSQANSFATPELLTLNKSDMERFIREEKGLEAYSHNLLDLFRMKAHTLSADQEKLLASLMPSLSTPRETYEMLNDAELPFPSVAGPDGEMVKITHGRYRAALYHPDRGYRERVYKGNYVAYLQLINTMATLYNGRVTERIAMSKLRNYKSAREYAANQDNIPISVYDNLVSTTNKNLGIQHRWGSLKKKVLGLTELHPYDTYVSLFPGVQKTYSFDEARNLILEALKPLGEEYGRALRMSFDNRWIDVYETKNKRSGAYSNGCGCGVHPWILMNWNGTLDDVFTLAHELGHNMHSYFTEKSQPYHYANYSIFVAEVASTTNEALLLDYMIEKATTKEEKAALLEKFLTNAQQTFFRQTQFAEFEMDVHNRVEKGEVLNAEDLTKLFGDSYQKYWGKEMVMDKEEGYSWARIPHLFKYNFYVYQYATGFSAAQALSEGIKKEGKPAIDRYLSFLSAGNSVYGIDALKMAGVDMTKPEPVQNALNKMGRYLDDLEKLIKK